MLFGQRLPIPGMRDEHIVIHAGVQQIIGRITIVAFEKHVARFRRRFYEVGNCEKAHSLPLHVELTPGRHIMEIAHVIELRQRHELFPIQSDGALDLSVDLELPFFQRNVRLDTQIEDRKIVDLTLSRREPIRRAHRCFLFPSHLASPAFFARDVVFFHFRIRPDNVIAIA